MRPDPLKVWAEVKTNETYFDGALNDTAGMKIKWHSPADKESSQVFCISAFGTLQGLPDRDEIFAALLVRKLPHLRGSGPWTLIPEHTNKPALGETGQGMPTNVDVFCDSPEAVVCVESKFLHDAIEGFGGCGQARARSCAGFYGPGSDLRKKSTAWCRLAFREGRRDPRNYWELGKRYFQPSVFASQVSGQDCPLKGPNYQLMRNFLFAAVSAQNSKTFGVLALVPEATSGQIRSQVKRFQSEVLQLSYVDHVAVATYDELAELLSVSKSDRGRRLSNFLVERMTTVLRE